jgi:PASTA domain
MSNSPVDTFSRGPGQVPVLVGQGVDAARAHANQHGWILHVNQLEPFNRAQPNGLVVAQRPASGTMLPAGSVLLVDAIRRRSVGDKYGRPILGGIAAALLAVAVVFVSLWSGERSDNDADRAALAAANTKIDDLEGELALAGGDADDRIAELQADLNAASAAAAAAEVRLDQANAKIDELTAAGVEAEAVVVERDGLIQQRDLLTQRVADLEAELSGVTAAVVAMPDFVGTPREGVADFAAFNRLELVVQEVNVVDGPPVEPGTVLAQIPAPSTPLIRGAAVVITVFVPPPV